MRSAKWLLMAAIVVACVSTASPGEASEEGAGWEISVAPYLWMAGIQGDIGIRHQKTDVDASFGDLLGNLDFALMLHTEARKGRWGVIFQPNYLSLSTGGELGPRKNIHADVDLETWIVEFGGFYRTGVWGGGRSFFDVLLGGRYWNFSTEMDVGIPVVGVAGDRSSEVDFVDPFAGIRFGTRLTGAVKLSIRCDIGGLGISGSTSDFSWQGMALVGYDLSKQSTVFADYRALGLDYAEDDLELDLTLHGPILGYRYQF